MPKIRSITSFVTHQPAQAPDILARLGDFSQAATAAFETAGITVQTRRLATQPFPDWSVPLTTEPFVAEVKRLFDLCQQHGIGYLAIGPVRQTDDAALLGLIADVFRAVPGVFATAEIASPQPGIDLTRLQAVARLTKTVSYITPDGMTNLYLAALANCMPGAPFFPVAYHDSGPLAFALAIQAADLVVSAFQGAPDPSTARQRLTDAIQATVDQLVPVAEELASAYELRFLGLDFSLAPYPVEAESLGAGLEALGSRFGGAGLVAAASLVMNAVEAADFPRTGFCGLMLPILEDSVLATRTAEGRLRLNDLLLLSAVCGTGLDCIPLPGDVSEQALRDILLDVAALALRLDKPLTARLMPFPDKQAGDVLAFDFEYFADSRVMPSPLAGATGLSQANPHFAITPRKDNR